MTSVFGMRIHPFAGVLAAFFCIASAVPATNHIPTAITQAAAGNSSTSASTQHFSITVPNGFDERVQVSGTDTVVWISEGRKVDYIPLRILLGRIQLDLDDRIAKYGPDAVPGLHPQAPKYSYYTTTPQGTECYFFISAFSQGALTYRLINETLAGLKVFLVGPGRNEQAVFQVEDRERMEAFGGLSVGPQARNLEALSNDTSVARDPTILTGIANMEVKLTCKFGAGMHPAIIALLLADTHEDVQAKIKSEGAQARLPGVAGEWERDGHRGAIFRIDGIAPAHITWQITQAAVVGIKSILVGSDIPKEAICIVIVGSDTVGVASVKKNALPPAILQSGR